MKKQVRSLSDERALDAMFTANDQAMIEVTRIRPEPVRVALAVLTMADGCTKRALMYAAEFGDGDGRAMVKDTIRRLKRSRQLAAGETLECFMVEFSLDDLLKTAVKQRM